MGDGYEVKHRDEFEAMEGSGGGHLAAGPQGARRPGLRDQPRRARRRGRAPREHDESKSGQEEIFSVLEGEGALVADGGAARRAGTFGRLAPAVKRTIRNSSDAPISALLIGVPAGSGYEPTSWG